MTFSTFPISECGDIYGATYELTYLQCAGNMFGPRCLKISHPTRELTTPPGGGEVARGSVIGGGGRGDHPLKVKKKETSEKTKYFVKHKSFSVIFNIARKYMYALRGLLSRFQH